MELEKNPLFSLSFYHWSTPSREYLLPKKGSEPTPRERTLFRPFFDPFSGTKSHTTSWPNPHVSTKNFDSTFFPYCFISIGISLGFTLQDSIWWDWEFLWYQTGVQVRFYILAVHLQIREGSVPRNGSSKRRRIHIWVKPSHLQASSW